MVIRCVKPPAKSIGGSLIGRKHSLRTRFFTLALLTFVCYIQSGLIAQEQVMRTIRLDPTNSRPVPELGIILGGLEKGDGVSVVVMLGQVDVRGADFREGDVVVRINKKPIKNLKEFDKHYKAANVGSTMEFEIGRGGKRSVLRFVKPKPSKQQPVFIRRVE